MNEILVVAIVGFAAAFVDGSLGMGFGPTSSSLLLASGISPVGVSTTVNIAKVVTGIAGGVAHWRFGNVDRRLATQLALPGVLGTFVGVAVLTSVDGNVLRPILAMLLAAIGVRMLARFRRPIGELHERQGGRLGARGVAAAGAAGGLTNGMIGAWGPVVTPYLLHRGLAPRFVVGSVNTAEIAVAFVAAGSLLTTSGAVNPTIVIAMLTGGTLAAPLAAWTVGRVPARELGVLIAGLLLLTNARELCSFGLVGNGRWLVYGAIVATLVWAWTWPRFHPASTAGHEISVDGAV